MARIWGILLFVLIMTLTFAKQSPASEPAQPAKDQPERVKVYSSGPGVTAPQLLPVAPFETAEGKCENEVDGSALLSILVDAEGRPRNPVFLQPIGNEMDRWALQIAFQDRFTPGTYSGIPAVVAQSLRISFHVCAEKKNETVRLMLPNQMMTQPVQDLSRLPDAPEEALLEPSDLNSIGDSVKAPVLVQSVAAEFTDEARRGKRGGGCIVSFVVDKDGKPQDVRIVEKLGYGLDQKAVEAVKRYQFKPAIKDGKPIPVTLTTEVEFRISR